MDFEKMKVAELKQYATDIGIEIPADVVLKNDIVDFLSSQNITTIENTAKPNETVQTVTMPDTPVEEPTNEDTPDDEVTTVTTKSFAGTETWDSKTKRTIFTPHK